MSKALPIIFILISSALSVKAQVKYCGRVVSSDGEAVPGVTVILRGTTTGTTTDLNGYYCITAPFGGGTLVASYVGLGQIELDFDDNGNVLQYRNDGNEDLVLQFDGGSLENGAPNLDIPKFDLPPPTPSARDILSRKFFDCKNLGCVNEILEEALGRNGYGELGYFYVPSGFALVTRMEKIDKEGYSKHVPERWELGVNTDSFTFWEYIETLIFGLKGYYRAIVFVVTSKDFGDPKEEAKESEVKAWYNQGYFSLPEEIAAIEFSKEHKVYALIYEFSQTENDTYAKISNPSSLTGEIHMTRSKILTWLEKSQLH